MRAIEHEFHEGYADSFVILLMLFYMTDSADAMVAKLPEHAVSEWSLRTPTKRLMTSTGTTDYSTRWKNKPA